MLWAAGPIVQTKNCIEGICGPQGNKTKQMCLFAQKPVLRTHRTQWTTTVCASSERINMGLSCSIVTLHPMDAKMSAHTKWKMPHIFKVENVLDFPNYIWTHAETSSNHIC